MRAQWRVADTDVTTRQALATATGFSPLLCQVLINRGITDAAAAGAFLTPSLHDLHDPYGLHGMKQAVQRLVAAIRQGECIAIYGDYDVDGVTATALLVTFFHELGPHIRGGKTCGAGGGGFMLVHVWPGQQRACMQIAESLGGRAFNLKLDAEGLRARDE